MGLGLLLSIWGRSDGRGPLAKRKIVGSSPIAQTIFKSAMGRKAMIANVQPKSP